MDEVEGEEEEKEKTSDGGGKSGSLGVKVSVRKSVIVPFIPDMRPTGKRGSVGFLRGVWPVGVAEEEDG